MRTHLHTRTGPVPTSLHRSPLAPLRATAGSGGAAAASPSSDGANMGAVLAAVGVACCGAFAFGYHLGVVNGPLEAIAKELGFAGNKALQGLVSVTGWMGRPSASTLVFTGSNLAACWCDGVACWRERLADCLARAGWSGQRENDPQI